MASGASAKGKREGGSAICIRLSRAQVDEVVRATGPESGILGLLRDLGAEPKLPIADPAELPAMSDRRFSRSVLTGLLVLACFTSTDTEWRVTDVAARLHMSASTTHRFIKTLEVAGLLEQNPDTRAYRLARR